MSCSGRSPTGRRSATSFSTRNRPRQGRAAGRGPFAGRDEASLARAPRGSVRQRPRRRSARRASGCCVKDLGFTATTILTLAVCLGANAAMFTVVYSVLLRPLPVPDSDRIVALGDVYPTITPNDILSNTAPAYLDRLEAHHHARKPGDVHALVRHAGDRRHRAGAPRHARHAVAVSRAAGPAGARAHVHRRRGRDRLRAEDHPEPRVVAAALRRRSGRDRQGPASRLDGPALHDRRRHAARLLVLRHRQRRPRADGRRRDPILDPARVHGRTEIRRRAHALWLLPHRPARGPAQRSSRCGRRSTR